MEEFMGRQAAEGLVGLYLYPGEGGELVVETSWLPAVPEVIDALKPLGFRRLSSGSYRAVLAGGREDRLGAIRLATKALGVLLQEAESG